jgi:hypothetical protein
MHDMLRRSGAKPSRFFSAGGWRIANPRDGRLADLRDDGGSSGRRKPLWSAEHRSARRFAGQLAEQCSALRL